MFFSGRRQMTLIWCLSSLFTLAIIGLMVCRGWQGGSLPYACLLGWGFGGEPVSYDSWPPLYQRIPALLAGLETGYLTEILSHGLPLPGEEDSQTLALNSAGLAPEQDLQLDPGGAQQQPQSWQVAIYHTHNAETYIPFSGRSKVDGQNGGVSLVAEEMIKVLSAGGIKAGHDLTIHDYPDFPTSYIRSEVTARRLVQKNPGLQVLIDLHRDAGLPRKETVKVGGREAARVMLVVGNGTGLANPHWRENYEFAQRIGHLLEERYPGLLKAVRLKDGRYNQHLFNHAILVEVGSDKNTLEEAELAGRCLAEVLGEIIRGGEL